MNRQHVHFVVDDLTDSIRFYLTLFATEPSVLRPDCAKWSLDEPGLNFTIVVRGMTPDVTASKFSIESVLAYPAGS